jgi:hypothetical protein
MLPERLSTDPTSLREARDRLAVTGERFDEIVTERGFIDFARA